MVTRDELLRLIRETAVSNGGRALGSQAFSAQTGVRESEWRGRYAPRWGDLVKEAGLLPSPWNERIPDSEIAEALARMVKALGHFPTVAERKMLAGANRTMPAHTTFANRGSQRELAQLLVSELQQVPSWSEEVRIAKDYLSALRSAPNRTSEATGNTSRPNRGSVYLIKTPRGHRIGMTTRAVGSRLAEHENQQGEADLLHRILTDDPVGVERYWHQRFASRRSGTSDHFILSSADVTAFKRWKKIF